MFGIRFNRTTIHVSAVLFSNRASRVNQVWRSDERFPTRSQSYITLKMGFIIIIIIIILNFVIKEREK